ncbi:hypothetical protein D1AOALGA4SA_5134 [Olavius algarvensis Delta 1 endosymbiont]|nr:hypothetical protein D1AOALGA4SA_5134 [Olavius algarvensis Delta 1 endosymbiont]
MNNDGFASLSRFKMDRSTKDSRQAEYLRSAIRNLKSKIEKPRTLSLEPLLNRIERSESTNPQSAI